MKGQEHPETTEIRSNSKNNSKRHLSLKAQLRACPTTKQPKASPGKGGYITVVAIFSRANECQRMSTAWTNRMATSKTVLIIQIFSDRVKLVKSIKKRQSQELSNLCHRPAKQRKTKKQLSWWIWFKESLEKVAKLYWQNFYTQSLLVFLLCNRLKASSIKLENKWIIKYFYC